MGAGGISGAPVAARSLEVLKRLYSRVGDQLVIISVGGITTPEQAWERITSGATLLQGYTGLIYGGLTGSVIFIRALPHRFVPTAFTTFRRLSGQDYVGNEFKHKLRTVRVLHPHRVSKPLIYGQFPGLRLRPLA